MRSQCSITTKRVAFIGALLLGLAMPGPAQRLAIVTPDRTEHDVEYSARLTEHIRTPIKFLDLEMVYAAFRSAAPQAPFNMSVSEAKRAAAVVGCDYLLLVRSGEQRRASFSRPEYYEAFAFLYLIDGRSGRLLAWKPSVFESDSQSEAARLLKASVVITAGELMREISVHAAKPAESGVAIEEVATEGSPAAVGLKPPIPYRRIKPEYTQMAFLYDVRATVDAEADVDADGTVLAVRFTRWAGFGLEESVEKAVRSMNWRPAMRNGKPLPMRILLRYNFTKVDK